MSRAQLRSSRLLWVRSGVGSIDLDDIGRGLLRGFRSRGGKFDRIRAGRHRAWGTPHRS
jgi:hypothetical protein